MNLLFFLLCLNGQAALTEKHVATVTGKEDFKSTMGFGADESMVRGMNLMMVEGAASASRPLVEIALASAFDVEAMISPNPPKSGANRLDFTLVDSMTKKPVVGQSLQAEVYMTSMDMGTEEPKVLEFEPGHYRVEVSFSMSGPWAIRLRSKTWNKVLNFDVGH